jgi:NADH-quinone oxidoreductase subunit L
MTVLLVTALGTAFYMWRLYFLVFWGECRADAETQKHIHESPASMTGPLVVLAVGSCGLGFLGLPHIGLPNFMASWLGMTIETWGALPPAHHLPTLSTVGVMAAGLVAGILGIAFAYHYYSTGPDKVRSVVASLGGFYKVVYNKFYVDEFFELVLVRPFRFVANISYQFIDRVVIDLVLVNGTAFVADVFGRLLRFIQNGDVQRYMTATVLGLFAMLWWTDCDPKVGFKSSGTAAEMKFVADYKPGPNFKNPEVAWDFTGDGNPDATGKEAAWHFDKPGKYKVTMWVGDTVYKHAHKVTRQVEVK